MTLTRISGIWFKKQQAHSHQFIYENVQLQNNLKFVIELGPQGDSCGVGRREIFIVIVIAISCGVIVIRR